MKKLTFLLSLLPLWAAVACSTPVQNPGGGDDGNGWDVDPWTQAHYIYLNKCSETITISFTGSEYHEFDSGTLTIKPNKRDTLTLTNVPGNWYQPFAYGKETVVTVSDGTRQFVQYGANEDKIFDWHYYDITYVSDAVRAFEYWIVEEFFPDDPEPAPDDEA